MFPNRYFAPSYFTGDYWPPLGIVPFVLGVVVFIKAAVARIFERRAQ